MAIRVKPADVAVVGLGAAGGVAVLPLARAGLKVVGIEAGTWMDPAKDFKADEVFNNVRNMVTTSQKGPRELPTFRTDPSQKAARRGTNHPMMNAIGGTSIHYHAQSWRLKPWDFQTRSEVLKRYGAGYLPKGSTLEDWPVSYDELEPFYDTVEYEVGVSGKAGNIQGKLDPAGNVFEGPRSREYPMPPLRTTDFLEHMIKAARGLGWKPFHSPAAINSVNYKGRASCAYHGYCDRGGCHVRAKNSTCFTTIPEALKTKHLSITDRAQVTRIVEESGKVTGVQYLRDGKEYFQPAKVVLLGSYTYENVRLLLLSKSKAFPDGLANNHGQVGKHYFGHWDAQAGAGVTALFPMDLNTWYGAILSQGVVIDEWADDSFDHSGLGFIGGASLTVNMEKHPIAAAAMQTFGKAPQWGAGWKKFVHENAGRWTSCYVQTNSFPYENTYLDLDPEVKDPLGDPVIRVTSGPKPNEAAAATYAQNKMEEWFKAAGAIAVTKGQPVGPGLSTHTYGGTRMGSNRETNVADKWGFAHEVPNLGFLGGSVFGTSGARNPTLTIQALAWRTADHLAKNWKSIAG